MGERVKYPSSARIRLGKKVFEEGRERGFVEIKSPTGSWNPSACVDSSYPIPALDRTSHLKNFPSPPCKT